MSHKDLNSDIIDTLVKYKTNKATLRSTVLSLSGMVITRENELKKSFGGCTNCYGKGYATVQSQINGYGTDGDIGGYEGKFKQDLPIQVKYCDCSRGKQLQGLKTEGVL